MAESCIDEALTRKPISSPDCNMLLRFYRLRNREKEALPVLINWFKHTPDGHGARVAFLSLVESYGNSEDIKTAINETKEWLLNHSEDSYVRTFYLGLVERCGTDEQVKQAIEETRKWLTTPTHSEVTDVRTFYLGLVERRGTDEQVENVLSETKEWLQKHTNATDVWDTTISLLIRFNQIEEAGTLAIQAISLHPDNNNLINQYLRLFHSSDDEQTIRKLFGELIKKFPRLREVLRHFAAWLRDHNQIEEARQLYVKLINQYPSSYQIRHGYGRLLLKEERYVEGATEFQAALKLHAGHQMAHDGLAYAMSKIGEIAEAKDQQEEAKRFYEIAEKEFQEAIRWARNYKEPQGVFYANLGWFYLSRNRLNEAKTAFECAISENEKYFENYWGIGRAYIGLRNFQSAANALQIALDKAEEAKIILQPPASEEIPELLRQCEENLKNSLKEK